jgi:hypothetical protein
VDDATKENQIIKPSRESVSVNGAHQDKQDYHKEQVQHQRRINFTFDFYGTFMITGIKFMVKREFLNTHPGTDKKENDKGFSERIQNTGKDHKSHMIGMKDVELNKTLKKSDPQAEKS